MVCGYCKSERMTLKETEGKTGLYCLDCGRWLKWVGAEEKSKLEADIQKQRREMRIDGADLEKVREKYAAYKKKYTALSEEVRFYQERVARKQAQNEMEASTMYDKALKLKDLMAKMAAYDEVLVTLRLK